MDTKGKTAMLQLFDSICKNSIAVSYSPAEDTPTTVQSKIGGKPWLPCGFVWPYYEEKSYDQITANRPLAFLAQIDLSEIAPFDGDSVLPKSGVLSFFYEMETQFWGFDPKDKGSAKVFYFEDKATLCEALFPEDLHRYYQFPQFALSFTQRGSLPSYGDFYGISEEKGISAQFDAETADLDWDDYDALRAEYSGCPPEEWENGTKLLGYPDVIQNPMEEQCEQVTRGFYLGDGEPEIPDDLQEEIAQASKDWVLLFQMGTVEHGDFALMFGDCGYIYFWIKKQDLAEKNFDNSWLVLQCC